MTRGEAYTDLITFLCGAPPPFKLPENLETLSKLTEAEYESLQGFIASNIRLRWMTGIGTLEAMDIMVGEAINNSDTAFERARPAMGDVEETQLKGASTLLTKEAKRLTGSGQGVMGVRLTSAAKFIDELLAYRKREKTGRGGMVLRPLKGAKKASQ